MKKRRKRILSLLLTAVLVLTMNPVVYADTISDDAVVEMPADTDAAAQESSETVPDYTGTENDDAEKDGTEENAVSEEAEPSGLSEDQTDVKEEIDEQSAVSEDTVSMPEIFDDDSLDEEAAGDEFDPTELKWITTSGQIINNGTGNVNTIAGTAAFNSMLWPNRYAGFTGYTVKFYYSSVSEGSYNLTGYSDYILGGDALQSVVLTSEFAHHDNPDGYYKFSVQAESVISGKQYHGKEFYSDAWHYTNPGTGNTLPQPTGLSWNNGKKKISFNKVDGSFNYLGEFKYDHPTEGAKTVETSYSFPDTEGIMEMEIPGDVNKKAREAGAAKIYARVRAIPDDVNKNIISNYSDTLVINMDEIPGPLTAINFNNPPGSIEVGDTVTLALTLTPADAANKEVVWSTTTQELISVDQTGRVTALKAGSGTATVNVFSATDPSITNECSFYVNTRSPRLINEGDSDGIKWSMYDNGKLDVYLGNCVTTSKVPWKAYLNKITEVHLDGYTEYAGSLFYDMPVLKKAVVYKAIKEPTGFFHNCPDLEIVAKPNLDDDEKGDGDIDYPLMENGKERSYLIIGKDSKKRLSIKLGTKNAMCLPDNADLEPDPDLDCVNDRYDGTNISKYTYNLEKIGARAFYGQALPYVQIPSNIKLIGDEAFADCSQMSCIFLESEKIKLEGDPFAGCDNLSDVYFSGSESQWETIASKSKVLQNAKLHKMDSDPEKNNFELCTVSFNSNGGDRVNDYTVVKGNTIASLPEVCKDGYVLEGWYLDGAFTRLFEEGKTVVDNNIVLYAKWKEAGKFKVCFYSKKNADGSWKKIDEQTVYEKQYAKDPAPKGETEDEKFVGWYSDEDLKKSFDTAKTRITGDINLYARWTKHQITARSVKLSSGVTIAYEMEYTQEVIYDGRKHIVGELYGKKLSEAKETSKVNPDITVDDFYVMLNGEPVTGIKIKGFSYENNVYPSDDGVSKKPKMYVYPVLKYDKKDEGLKEAIEKCPKLKKTLNAMMKPSYNSKKKTWNYAPVTVNVKRIALTGSVPVYTKADLASDESLKTADGILVWNGGKFKRKTKKITNEDGEKQTVYLKTTVPGLYYQKAVTLPNGETLIKKISLRPGEFNCKKQKWFDDEEGWVEYYSFAFKSTSFDYYSHYEDGTAISLNAGGDDEAGAMRTKKTKLGYFDGTMPSITEVTGE